MREVYKRHTGIIYEYTDMHTGNKQSSMRAFQERFGRETNKGKCGTAHVRTCECPACSLLNVAGGEPRIQQMHTRMRDDRRRPRCVIAFRCVRGCAV